MDKLRNTGDDTILSRVLDPRFRKSLEMACFELELRCDRYTMIRDADERFVAGPADYVWISGGLRPCYPEHVKDGIRFLIARENEAHTDFARFTPARVHGTTMRKLYQYVMYGDYMTRA